MAWLTTASGAARHIGMGSGNLPHYRRAPATLDVMRARLRLRTSSYAFHDDRSRGGHGLLWAATSCPLCAVPAPTAQPTLDAWHRVCEFSHLDAERAAAFASAAARATAAHDAAVSSSAPIFQDVALHMHTPWGRAFVFLATMGALLPSNAFDGGLPPSWVACLAAPSPDRRRVVRTPNIAMTVTLPAFADLARAVARPLPAAASVPPATAALPPPAVALPQPAPRAAAEDIPPAAAAAALDETDTSGLLPAGLLDEP